MLRTCVHARETRNSVWKPPRRLQGGSASVRVCGVQPTWCFGSIYSCSFLQLTWILPAAAKLSCSYSGFSSPRVEWKFSHGDIRGLVCYNNKITGESLHLLADCLLVEGLVVLGFQGRGAPWGSSLQGLPIALAGGRKRAPVSWVLPSSASLSSPAHSSPASSPLAASYENRVTFSDTGISNLPNITELVRAMHKYNSGPSDPKAFPFLPLWLLLSPST